MLLLVFLRLFEGKFWRIEVKMFVLVLVVFVVGLFLFISGYLSNSEEWNYRERLIKVIIPYFL